MGNAEKLSARNRKEPVEDRVFKMAAQFMGKELLPLMGIEGTVKRSAPTEQVYMNLKALYEDFNYEMEDGTWKHLEFQSDSVTKEDLRRFRAYEAVLSFQYRVEVTTYVLCSSRAKNPVECLSEGINTYRVHLVRLKDYDVEKFLHEIEEKRKSGQTTREELLKLLLVPLMDGNMEQIARIRKGVEVLRAEQGTLEETERMNMMAVLYALAMKFLSADEILEVKEIIGMTIVGEMLRQDGIEIGKEIGVQALVESLVKYGIAKKEILSELMEKFELSQEKAEELFKKYSGSHVK